MNIVFGASGHAKEIYWLIRSVNKFNVDYFVGIDNVGEYICGVEIISESEFYKISPLKINYIFLGIGNSSIRSKIYNKLKSIGFNDSNFPNLIHPNVILKQERDKIKLGIGCVICASSILTTEVSIGNFVHININSTISHECSIGDFTTISPCCCICGKVYIGENVFLGAKAIIIDGISICNDAIIGAGAVVVKNIELKGTYCGVPAKRIKI